MDIETLWLLWLICGVSLLLIDVLLLNSYILLWFGAGAMAAGATIYLAPSMPVYGQLGLFGAYSALFLGAWLKLVRPKFERKALRKAREELAGVKAGVVRFSHGKGTLRLQSPIGGRVVWSFVCDGALKPGDSVTIAGLDDSGVIRAETPSPQPEPEPRSATP